MATVHAIELEVQQVCNLSPAEARILAHRVQELVDERISWAWQTGQIAYQAAALADLAGKPPYLCGKLPVRLTLFAAEDAQIWASEGPVALRRLRVHRMIYEALMQGGVLSQEDLACLRLFTRRSR